MNVLARFERPLVIAIHGAVTNSASWIPLKRELGEFAEVVTPDLPGHGTRKSEPFRLSNAVAIIEELVPIDAHGRPIVLVGDSLGGYVATVAAARLGDRVGALVAAGTSFEMTGIFGFAAAATDLPGRLAAFILGERAVGKWFARYLSRLKVDQDTIDAMVALGFRPAGRSESLASLRGLDILDALRRFPGTTYIVNGGLDIPITWFTKRFAAAAVDGYAVTMPMVGHGCALLRPVEFSEIVRAAITRTTARLARTG